MHVSTWGVRDLWGATLSQTPSWLLSDALTSDPIHRGRPSLSIGATRADKTGLEVNPGASGFPDVSWSGAKTQVSLHKVLLVLRSRVASCRCKVVFCFY